jgi:hypothetical protein
MHTRSPRRLAVLVPWLGPMGLLLLTAVVLPPHPATAWLLTPAHAQPKKDAPVSVEKQKQAAEALLKKLAIKDIAHYETPNLLLYSTTSEAKLKTLSEGMQKQFALAQKVLRFEEGKAAWAGKLALFIFPNRLDFVEFVRQVEKRSVLADDHLALQLTGDTPYLAVGPVRGASGEEVNQDAMIELIGALIRGRVGTAVQVPEAVLRGFAWAIAARTNPTKAVLAERKQLQTLIKLNPKRTIREAWDGSAAAKEAELMTNSLVEWVFFGPEASKSTEFLMAFRPGENGQVPSLEQALDIAKYGVPAKVADPAKLPNVVERVTPLWQRFVLTGR